MYQESKKTHLFQELDKAIKSSLRKEELADFFNENREGKLTKTKQFI